MTRHDPSTRPADTRTMRIVHNALRRDLARGRATLTRRPYPHPAQRRALGAHLAWMMAFLHHHHSGEDAGLYPLVRARNPAAAALLDRMDADHQAIEPAMAELAAAGEAYAASDDARDRAIGAIDDLCDVLLPHLLREEEEMMPVVAATISEAEWDAWTQEYNVGTRKPLELATEGLWILEGQTPEDQRVMAAVVPPVPRWLILHVFSRGYRKQAFARWWSEDHSPWKLRAQGSSVVEAPATPAQVWAVLGDPTRTGEWSHECHSVRWLDGATEVAVGARFVGSNKVGRTAWKRACTVTEVEAGRTLAFRTRGPLGLDATEWRFELAPAEGGGTRIEQHFRVLQLPPWYDRLIWWSTPSHRDRRRALQEDLVRLGDVSARDGGRVVA